MPINGKASPNPPSEVSNPHTESTAGETATRRPDRPSLSSKAANATAIVSGHVWKGSVGQEGWSISVGSVVDGEAFCHGTATTDATGSFRIGNLPAGELTVQADGRSPWRGESRTEVVTLGNGESRRVDFLLPAERRIHGTIGTGSSGVIVSVNSGGTVRRAGRTDSNGRFSLMTGEEAAELLIMLHPHGHGNVVIGIDAGTADVDLGTIRATRPSGGITGTIRYDDLGTLKPARALELRAVRRVGGVEEVFGAARTDGNGAYRFHHLPDGTYRVRSRSRLITEMPWPATAGSEMPDEALLLRGPDEEVEVTGGAVATCDVALGWTAAVGVSLVDRAGEPVTEATVVVEREGFEDVSLVRLAHGEQLVGTNQFRGIVPLDPGVWTVRVRRDGFEDVTEEVDLVARRRTFVTVTVE